MSVVKTIQAGNSIIHTKSSEVKDILSEETREVIQNLVDTMRAEDLVGMAAPQIEKSLRIFVTEVRKTRYRSGEELDTLRVFINPEIVEVSEELSVGWEGCGSVADSGLFAKVERPASVKVKAINEKGEEFIFEAEGLLSAVVQHEIDHLNGVLFVEKMDSKTCMSRSEYLKMKSK